MSDKKYFTFGAGWLKKSKNGSEYYSCVVEQPDSAKSKVRIVAMNENGETAPIENFVVMFNDKRNKKGEVVDTLPDIRLTFSMDT